MEPFFPDPSYDTPDGRRRFLDRLSLNTRLYFAAEYVIEVFRSRSIALNGRYDREAWAASSYRVVELIEASGGRFHLRGLENLRACQGPVVFISNHMSTLETMVLPSIIAPIMPTTFVVKESLVRHPLFGPVMRARDPIVVNRRNAREDFQAVMSQGKELLSKGISVIIFPQSTRTVEFVPEEFNSLGIKLAKASNAQFLPIALKTDFWGNGKRIKELGPINRECPIYMTFGEPSAVKGTGKEEHKQVIDFISEHLLRWGGRVIG